MPADLPWHVVLYRKTKNRKWEVQYPASERQARFLIETLLPNYAYIRYINGKMVASWSPSDSNVPPISLEESDETISPSSE